MDRLPLSDLPRIAFRVMFGTVGWGAWFRFLPAAAFWTLVASPQTAPSSLRSADQAMSIHGVVLNANTSQPVERALVQAEGKSILTAHDGRFDFANLSGTTVSVKVTKPGFYQGVDPSQMAASAITVGLAEDAQIRIYPEAIISGTLIASNGDPLPQILVRALRRANDETGGRWTIGGQAPTNGDGEFRIPVPGGDYVIETQYSQPRSGGGRIAALPVVFPISAANAASPTAAAPIHLASGSEQHLDVHPPTRPIHSVDIEIDGGDGGSDGVARGQASPRVQAQLSNGLFFYPSTRAGTKPGEVLVTLPSGSYVLSASANGRENGMSYGETKLTVADEDVSGVSIHLQPAAELVVEASVDPSASSTSSNSSPPTEAALAQQLGIYLEKTDAGLDLGSNHVSPIPRRGGTLSFSLLPGTYRLRSTTYNSWYIESATAAGTDLLAKDLVIDGGSASLPLRIQAGNASATIKGTVKLAGNASACYVYMLAAMPTTSPVISTRAGQDGTFTRSMLPPGSYRVLASESRSFFDLSDGAVQRNFASYLQTVTVGQGESGNVDLVAVPAAEWKP